MGNPNAPSSAPTPPENSILGILWAQGSKADLKEVLKKNNDAEIVQTDRARAKTMSAEKREYLARQINAWRNANKDITDAEKLKEKARVLDMLHELKDDIGTPAIPRAASEIGQTVASIPKQILADASTSREKIGEKLIGDTKGMMDKNVPVADKLLTGAKYVAGVVGLVWLWKTIKSGWNKAVTGTTWYAKLGKFLGIGATLGAVGVGASTLIANTSERSFGPRLNQQPSSATPKKKTS